LLFQAGCWICSSDHPFEAKAVVFCYWVFSIARLTKQLSVRFDFSRAALRKI
jgi:hypothetical protein